MSNPSIRNVPPHLAQYYRHVLALLAAQARWARVQESDYMTDREFEEAEAARDRAFERVFVMSIEEARRLAATIPYAGEGA